jgi:very-short-patch-repair endonuclease
MPHSVISTQTRNRAKELRQRMTRAETLVWRYLKAGRLNGLSFRRQTPMGEYIVDFVCHTARIVVEVDGETHDFAARIHHDRRRDAWFASRGYVVLRFTNDDVMRGLEGVLLTIAEAARAEPHPLPNPPPQGGREQVP